MHVICVQCEHANLPNHTNYSLFIGGLPFWVRQNHDRPNVTECWMSTMRTFLAVDATTVLDADDGASSACAKDAACRLLL